MGPFTGLEHIVREQEPLAPHTWLRIGGAAEYFAEPTSVEELAGLVRRCAESDLPVRVLGGGSNVLVREAGVRGLVVHLATAAFSQISINGATLRAGSGAKLGHLISTAVREGLAGLEPLAGIPGTVGGALRGNIDANGTAIGQHVSQATMMTRGGDVVTHARDQIRFAYRQSSLDELVILDADFSLERDNPATLTKRMQKFWIVKQSQQPTANDNPVAVFRDVGGMDAATLIEQAGLRSALVGSVAVSERNAGYLVARQGATSGQVLDLIDTLRRGVQERLGVDLEPQIDIW